MKLGKKRDESDGDVLSDLAGIYSRDQAATVLNRSTTLPPEISDTGMPKDQDILISENQATPVPNNQNIVVPQYRNGQASQYHNFQTLEDRSSVPLQDQDPLISEDHNIQRLQYRNTEVDGLHDIVPLGDQGTTTEQDQNIELPEYQWTQQPEKPTPGRKSKSSQSEKKGKESPNGFNKRDGWKQMTIWVRKEMEPQMKLLSHFEGESISEMVRTDFHNRLQMTPFKDIINDAVKKKKIIDKNL